MPLVDGLRFIHAAVKFRDEILRKPHEGLNCQKYVCNQPKSGMGRLETVMAALVDFYNHQAGDKEVETEIYGGEMEQRALTFLGRRMRRLEDEDGLCDG